MKCVGNWVPRHFNLTHDLKGCNFTASIARAQANEAILPHLNKELFPGGAKAPWWLKAVQLDLEAKGMIKRGPKSPVRLFKLLA
jgi:hypothetical protein